MRRALRVSLLVCATLTLAATPGAAVAKTRVTLLPDIANLGSPVLGVHHPPRKPQSRAMRLATARAQAAAYGGQYVAYTGESVQVLMSDGFVPDDSVGQSWADFIARLVHGFEIGRVTVYVAPLAEVQARCGESATACYLYDSDLLIVPGDQSADGSSLEDVAAHEYGHHVASWRRNPPWDAFNYGPKRWATYERICPRVREGSAVIGDPNAYHLDPGEAVAEAYTVLNGGQWAGIVDDSFLPNATSLRALRRDVVTPWARRRPYGARGRFGRSRRARWLGSLTTPLDGQVLVSLRGPRRSDFDLFVTTTGGRRLARSTRRGSNERVQVTVCGEARIRVVVRRFRGSGRFRVAILRP